MQQMQAIWKGSLVEVLIAHVTNLGKAVYDPSYRKSGSYWQWSNVAIDMAWEQAAENVHKGWPTKMSNLQNQSAIYFGVLDEDSRNRWFYRVYPGGRDSFDRPGRYFFVLFRIESLDQILLPEVSGVLTYFEFERGLPLNTAPLDGEIRGEQPSDILSKLHRNWLQGNNGIHWGMDGNGTVIRFASPISPLEPPTKMSPKGDTRTPLPIQRNPIIAFPKACAAGFVIGLIVGWLLGYQSGSQSKSPVVPTRLPTNEGGPNERTNPEGGPNERTNSEGGVEKHPTK